MEGGKLCDMIAQIGMPTFFYTLFMADMSWPDLHDLMPKDPSAPGLSASQASQVRYRNLTGNPHIVASYLMRKHHLLMDTVLNTSTSLTMPVSLTFGFASSGKCEGLVHSPTASHHI